MSRLLLQLVLCVAVCGCATREYVAYSVQIDDGLVGELSPQWRQFRAEVADEIFVATARPIKGEKPIERAHVQMLLRFVEPGRMECSSIEFVGESSDRSGVAVAVQAVKRVCERMFFDERTVAGLRSAGTVHLSVTLAKRPNQSLEPTPTAGTSAAEQPLVPAAVVAHL